MKWQPKLESMTELTAPYECPHCGGHVALDSTWFEQVGGSTVCPYCNTVLDEPDNL